MKKITLALFCLVTTIVTSQNLIGNPEFDLALTPTNPTAPSVGSWTTSPFGTPTALKGAQLVPDATTPANLYIQLSGETGSTYQKVAVLPNSKYTCKIDFRYINAIQSPSGFGYAIEVSSEAPLTPPNLAQAADAAAVPPIAAYTGAFLKTFCNAATSNTNAAGWTQFSASNNYLNASPETRTFTIDTPSDATFVYICIGGKGANSRIDVDKVSLVYTSALSTNQFEKTQFAVYPNPAKSEVNISNIQGEFSYKIYDVSGKISKSELNQVSNTINISDLKSGIYFIDVTNAENIKSTSKLIKL